MEKKRNEKELGETFRFYGMYAKKSGDRRYITCPNCRVIISTCPRCHTSLLLKKPETLPDFVISPIPLYVEGKSAPDGRFDMWASFSEIQENVLGNHKYSFLWLDLGDGRAPLGRQAYLIPWNIFHSKRKFVKEQYQINSVVMKPSVRGKAPAADALFDLYRLEWVNGKWSIPKTHLFWEIYLEILNCEIEEVNEYVGP